MKSSIVVRVDVKQSFVIHKSDSQVIEEADATNYVYRKVFHLGEIYDCIPLDVAYSQCDFVAAGSRS